MSGTISESRGIAGEKVIEEVLLMQPLNSSETTSNGEGAIFDLKAMVTEINLYEDVYTPTMYGNLVITDAINALEKFPIYGTEVITIKLRTNQLDMASPENMIYKSFQLYKISDVVLNTDREAFYKLHFTSLETFRDKTTNITKRLSGDTAKLAKQIYDQHIQKENNSGNKLERVVIPAASGSGTGDNITSLVITDTDSSGKHNRNITYVSNFWSPFQNMAYLSRKTKGNTQKSPSYLFYESNKAFYFSSLETMAGTRSPFDMYAYVPETIRDFPTRALNTDGSSAYYGNALPKNYMRITEMKVPSRIDVLRSYNSGALANSASMYDFTLKKVRESTYDLRKNFQDYLRTGVGSPVPYNVAPNPLARRKWCTTDLNLFGDKAMTYNATDSSAFETTPANDTYVQGTNLDGMVQPNLRSAYLAGFEQFTFEITIPGRTDIEVGVAIDILYPSVGEKLTNDATDIYDEILTGRYLVTSIHHRINYDDHIMYCEVVKNGLQKNLGKNTGE